MNLILFGIYILLSIVVLIISIFVGNIILFDSLLLGILAGLLCSELWTIHPAICLLIGVVVLASLLILQRTKFGFWIIGSLMTLLWSAAFGVLAYFISERDPMWGWVVFGLAVFILAYLHFKARDSHV